jgi:hypothetical protein
MGLSADIISEMHLFHKSGGQKVVLSGLNMQYFMKKTAEKISPHHLKGIIVKILQELFSRF